MQNQALLRAIFEHLTVNQRRQHRRHLFGLRCDAERLCHSVLHLVTDVKSLAPFINVLRPHHVCLHLGTPRHPDQGAENRSDKCLTSLMSFSTDWLGHFGKYL